MIEIKEKIRTFYKRHERYFSTVWGVSFAASFFMAIINWLYAIFVSIQAGSFFGFLITVVFHSFIVFAFTIIGAFLTAIVIFSITLIPYLIIRGFLK